MTWRNAMRKLQSWLLPWPRPDERKAAIEQARRDAERSEGRVERARQVRDQIFATLAENHIAARIAEDIIARHGGDNR